MERSATGEPRDLSPASPPGAAGSDAAGAGRADVAATVVITTKNRRDELRRAVGSALEQRGEPEVLIIDDGSTDGTAEMVRREFPAARLDRSEQSLGLVVQRNRAAGLARGRVIFSIDDDAAFTTPNVVEQTLSAFAHPRIAAVAIPYINVLQDDVLRQAAPKSAGIYATSSFIGTAHALRRDLFLAVGGYRSFLFHQGEERDLCIRLLDRGYVVRCGSSDPIHHFESPRRDLRRMDLYGRRNDILFGWHNAPLGHLPAYLAATTVKRLAFGARIGRLRRMGWGLLRGYGACVHEWRERAPVRSATFRLYHELERAGCVALEAIEPRLPPLA